MLLERTMRLTMEEIRHNVIYSPSTGLLWIKKPNRKTFVNHVAPGIVEIRGKLYTKRYLAFAKFHDRLPRIGVNAVDEDQTNFKIDNLVELPRVGVYFKRGAWWAALRAPGGLRVYGPHEDKYDAELALDVARFIELGE